jgi:hypothetical protein
VRPLSDTHFNLGNDKFELKSDESMANFIKPSTQQMGEKKRNKREGEPLSPSQKSKTQSQSLRGDEQIMFQSRPSMPSPPPPPFPQEAYNKRKE